MRMLVSLIFMAGVLDACGGDLSRGDVGAGGDGDTEDEAECGVANGAFWGCEGQRRQLCSYPEGRCLEPKRECSGAWCRIPAVTFLMGSAEQFVDLGELPRSPVRLTRPFYIQKDETTVTEWVSVMGHDPSTMDYPRDFDYPVFGMSFFDILEYANRRSAADGFDVCYELERCVLVGAALDCERATFVGPECEGYRLPSAAEWELVAGEGTGDCVPGRSVRPVRHSHGWLCSDWRDSNVPVRYCHNAEVSFPGCVDLRAYDGPSCAGPGPVGEFAPSSFGVRGLIGNVLEYSGSFYKQRSWRESDVTPEFEIDPGYDTVLYDRADVGETEQLRGLTMKGGSFRLALGFTCSYSRQNGGFGPEPLAFAGFRLVRTALE